MPNSVVYMIAFLSFNLFMVYIILFTPPLAKCMPNSSKHRA